MMFLNIIHVTKNSKRMIHNNLNKIITTQDIIMNQRAFGGLLPKPSNARPIILIEDVFDVLFDFESVVLLAPVGQFTKSLTSQNFLDLRQTKMFQTQTKIKNRRKFQLK